MRFLEGFSAPREKTRIGAAFIYATRKAQQRLNNGHKIREDDFFSVHPPDRSAAEEIIEGVLIAAQREHEEKKVPYYGYLLANIAFTPTISRVHGNLLIRLGQSLSYNQLCLLAVFALKDKFGLRTGDYRGTSNVSLNILDYATRILWAGIDGVDKYSKRQGAWSNGY